MRRFTMVLPMVLLWIAAAGMLAVLPACTPQQALLSSLVPDGTSSILLSHIQLEEERTRKQVAALEAR